MGRSYFLGNCCFTDNLDKPLNIKDVKIGNQVMVIYEGKRFLGKVLGKKCRNKVALLREVMALQSQKFLNDYGKLYFMQRCFIQKLFQKCFFQQKMALAVLSFMFSHLSIMNCSKQTSFKKSDFFPSVKCPSVTTRQSLMKLQKSPFL